MAGATFKNGFLGGASAFWLHNGAFTSLGAPGAVLTAATGVNDMGQVVGLAEYADGSFAGTLWDHGGLAATYSFPGTTDTSFSGINDHGTIVGTINDTISFPAQGIIGSVVPEPGSLVLLSLVALAAGGVAIWSRCPMEMNRGEKLRRKGSIQPQ